MRDMTIALEPPTEDGIELRLRDALRAAAEPLAVSKIRASLPARQRAAAEELQSILEALVARGAAYRFAPYRTQNRAPRYWDRSPVVYVRQLILAALQGKNRSARDLEKALQRPLADWKKQERQEAIGRLVSEGAVYRLPPLPGSKAVRYSLSPPDPADYLRAAMNRFLQHENKVEQQLAPLGIQPRQVREATLRMLGREPSPNSPREPSVQAAPDEVAGPRPRAGGGPTDDELLVLQAIRELGHDPRLGGFVSIADLRRTLDGRLPASQRFDETLWRLAQARQVDLYPHDYPGSLTNEERRQLLFDERGRCFNGVSLRDAPSSS
jgi:hypothetical protein